MNECISAEEFDVWATYYSPDWNWLYWLPQLSSFPCLPQTPPLAASLLRGCDALQNIHLPGVCTQMWPQPSLPTCSYLCSQFAWSRSQYPGVAPGRSPPSPSDSWGLWHGGRWWRTWSRWGVRQFQYCSQSLTQRLSRRSQGLAGHWQSK